MSLDYPDVMVIIIVLIGSITDLRTGKIPNKLTFPAALLGIIVSTIYTVQNAEGELLVKAVSGALNGILGWIVGVFIMSITKLFMPRFGHGDTKLVAAVGSFVGPGLVFIAYVYYCLAFGVFALARLLLAFPWRNFIMAVVTHQHNLGDVILKSETLTKVRKQAIPVAPFIAVGAILTVVFKEQTLKFLNYK